MDDVEEMEDEDKKVNGGQDTATVLKAADAGREEQRPETTEAAVSQEANTNGGTVAEDEETLKSESVDEQCVPAVGGIDVAEAGSDVAAADAADVSCETAKESLADRPPAEQHIRKARSDERF